MAGTTNAKLDWRDTAPVSNQFDDIYFSIDDGLEETRFVFLEGNNLANRYRTANSLCIAETGFGTGLNFLAAWQQFLNQACGSTKLTYISVEKYPVSNTDLARSLNHWPELHSLSEQLLSQYPDPVTGFHNLQFDQGRVTLLLMFGDAAECYSQLDAKVDAWFLDGFAPSKNPQMWSPELFRHMASLSHDLTTFSTFTCAGIVKRGLKTAGFEIKKVPGFGRKREMLVGHYTGEYPEGNTPPERVPSWFRLPEKYKGKKSAIVIGAGIAGCSTAYSLAQRGWQVTLIDRRDQIAQEGSGNRQGALYAKLPIEPIPASRIHLSGYLFSSRFLQQNLADRTDIWSPCGLLQIASSDKEQQKHRKLAESGNYPESVVRFVEQSEACNIAGIPLTNSALHFPSAGWVTPPLLCEWLTEHPNITVQLNFDVKQLEHNDNLWTVTSDQGTAVTAPVCIIASAADSVKFDQLNHLPVQAIRGQVSLAEGITPAGLNTVLCSEGYISPAKEDTFCFGATFDLKDNGTDIRNSGHRHNLEKVTDMAPDLGDQLRQHSKSSGLNGRVGFRCASPDKLPIIGPAPVYNEFCEDYARLSHDRKLKIETDPKHYPGLYVNLAHGSKGLISGPISGEIIASMIERAPLPLEIELIEKLSPARFIIKNLIRRTI